MKICIPIEFLPQGGAFYFLRQFKIFLAAADFQVTEDIDDKYDLFFTSHWMVPRTDILRAIRKNPDIRIIQRVGGSAQDYGRFDDADARQGAVNRLADLTIFQSEYCRHSAREKYPVIGQDGPVINNPVDSELFNPEGPRAELKGDIRVACISWSTNPMKGAASIYETATHNPSVSFFLCGPYPDAPDLPNIHHLGFLERSALAETLRSCHLLMSFSQNEACPNHVLEALASGLPVLYADSGAMAEIIGECGLSVSIETFPERLKDVMAARNELSRCARNRVLDRFHPDHIFPQYIDVMNEALKRPQAIPRNRRLALAWAEGLAAPFKGLLPG